MNIFVLTLAVILGYLAAEVAFRFLLLCILWIDKVFFGHDYSNCDCGKVKCNHLIKRITL